MAPPVRDGEMMQISIPHCLTSRLQVENRESFIASVSSMAKAFVTARASLYFSGSNLLYVSSYHHTDLEATMLIILPCWKLYGRFAD